MVNSYNKLIYLFLQSDCRFVYKGLRSKEENQIWLFVSCFYKCFCCYCYVCRCYWFSTCEAVVVASVAVVVIALNATHDCVVDRFDTDCQDSIVDNCDLHPFAFCFFGRKFLLHAWVWSEHRVSLPRRNQFWKKLN